MKDDTMLLDKIRKFVKTADFAVKIRDSNLQWETKYNLVFSDDLRGVISDTDIYFDWNDPDTTYESDTRAYVNVIEEKANELRVLL